MSASSDRLALHLWGVRGSIAAPGPATARWGGNTPCVEVRAPGGGHLALDAGTGIRGWGRALLAAWGARDHDPRGDGADPAEASAPEGAGGAGGTPAPRPVDVLVTHAHADHVQGLPFLAPLARADARVTVHAAASVLASVERGVRAVLAPPLFPVPFEARVPPLRFAALPDAGTTLGGVHVRAIEVAHPGGAAAFRLAPAAGGPAAVYMPDNELAAVEGVCGGRRALLEAIADAALLVHDATYLPAELAAHRGWGHSSYAEAVRLAADAGVPRLVLFHHHHDRDDVAMDRLARTAAAVGAAHGVAVEVACEGATLEV